MDYVLMTPVRNERHTLPYAARSLIDQTHRPKLWLIVDDGSTDGTSEVVETLASSHSWIISRRLPPGPGGLGVHFAEVVRYGFGELMKVATHKGIGYELIGKIDADVFFEASCFSLLVREFETDEALGVASPCLFQGKPGDESAPGRGKREPMLTLPEHLTDAIRLYRRECFQEIGGIEIARAPDTIATVRAVLRGWKLRRVETIAAGISRQTHSSTSLWSRLAMFGSEAWYLGYSPLVVLGRFCFELLFTRPIYRAPAYLYGYLSSAIRRDSRIDDREIVEYFRKRWPKQVCRQVPVMVWKAILRVVGRCHG